MKRTLLFVIFIGIVIALSWGGVRYLGGASVEVTHPVRGSAVLAVYATGTVEATVMLPIAPRSTAKLVELLADEGSQVLKGQVLARLEDEDVQSTLRQFEAQEILAKKTFERKAKLLKSGVIGVADYDSAKSAWEAAKALTAKASTETNFLKLTAPADGEIIKRDGEVGEMISAQQPVFWVRCCAPLRISVEVNEEDIALVMPNQEVVIRADAFPDKIFKGRVQSITPKGDPIARTYRVRVAFAEPVPLQIGMTAETNIMISKHDNALLVPSNAVINQKIWLVRDGKLIEQAIKQGAKGLKQVEVLSGVKETDLVVTQPAVTLKAGASVRSYFARSQ